jgi:radical SAM protein with 4Fe4S-binding SPASM domain
VKKNKFMDPAIDRKKKIIKSSLSVHDVFVMPSQVEISESGICNRTCAFCPKSDPNYPNDPIFIKTQLIEKVSSELGELGYSGIFVFSGFCEPLLDKNIFNLIRITRKNIPLAKIELVTNGDVLNEERMSKLIAAGLTTLIISAYDGEHQIEQFREMADRAEIDQEKLLIRPRYLGPDQDFGITLNNRAGSMDNAEFPIKKLAEPLKESCNYPFYACFIDYNGDVLLCPHDWRKMLVVGNLQSHSLIDVWKSAAMNNVRETLYNADRCFAPCNSCDVSGLIMGAEQKESWAAIRDKRSSQT